MSTSNQARHEVIAFRRLLKAEPDEGTYDAAHRVVSDLERLQRLALAYLEVTHEQEPTARRRLQAELGRRVRE